MQQNEYSEAVFASIKATYFLRKYDLISNCMYEKLLQFLLGITESNKTTLSALHPAATWTSAKATCEASGLTLLTIPSQAKEDAIGPCISNQE